VSFGGLLGGLVTAQCCALRRKPVVA
jgi:hypothetical protein